MIAMTMRPGGHDNHVQCYFAITLCCDYVSASGNNNEQECAPALRKEAPPLEIQELVFRPFMSLLPRVAPFL